MNELHLIETAAKQKALAAHDQGRLAQESGDFHRAKNFYRKALDHEPGRRRTLNNLAIIFIREGELIKAQDLLRKAITIGIDQNSDPAIVPILLSTMAQLELRKHQPVKARELLQRCALIQPDQTCWTNLAVSYANSGQIDSAIRSQKFALEINPNDDPFELLWNNNEFTSRGFFNHQQLQNLALQQLTQEPWQLKNWKLLEARLGVNAHHWEGNQCKAAANLWRGEYVEKLVIWDEQGYGDTLMSLRWLPKALKFCSQIELQIRPGLLGFVKCMIDKNELIDQRQIELISSESIHQAPWSEAVYCPWMSLPVALGLNGAEAIASQLSSRQATHEPKKVNQPRRIGLVWAAGGKPEMSCKIHSERRSLPAHELIRVLDQLLGQQWRNGAVELVNLQQDREPPTLGILKDVLSESVKYKDWLETSQALQDLDAVICVDTGIAHLAGILGIPTTLILNHPCDWRWGQMGAHTSWYPSIQLLRHRWTPEISGSA